MESCSNEITNSIKAGLFGATIVVNIAEGLGFRTLKGSEISSITYEFVVVKVLLDTVKNATGAYPTDVTVAVPGILYFFYLITNANINTSTANFGVRAREVTAALVECNYLLDDRLPNSPNQSLDTVCFVNHKKFLYSYLIYFFY